MNKGNKRLFVVAVLLLLVAVSLSTYAIYKSSATGSSSAEVAKWGVKINDTNIAQEDTFSFYISDIVWDKNPNVKEGKIAPGSTGKITFEIDASQSEVSVDYTVTLDKTNIENENIIITNEGENSSGTIAYSSNSDEMKKTITINVVWMAEDEPEVNKKDTSMQGTIIEIPVTVTATQHTGI